MAPRKVEVLPYDPAWKDAFSAICAEVESAVGDLILGIEHVGSTSVEGLPAKPIIDLDVVIADDACFAALAEKMEQIGYYHEGNLGIPGREAFGYEGKTHLMKHHLYVCVQSAAELRRHIVFRDYLRAHPDAAAKYAAVKQEAARLYPYDIDGYIRHKSGCIEDIYRLCGLL